MNENQVGKMNKTVTALSAALVLAACTSGVPKPRTVPALGQTAGNWFQLTQYDAGGNVIQNSLLAVEQNKDSVRFVQTDALGAPLARQVLTQKGWRNDGFVMPNAAARRLFGAMLPVLAEDSVDVYPDLESRTITGKGECYHQLGRELWCVVRDMQRWQVTFPDNTKWAVTPIQE